MTLLTVVYRNFRFGPLLTAPISSPMAASAEKVSDFKPQASEKPVAPSYFNPVSPFFDAYERFARWRADLGLPQPGTVENLQKEVKGTSMTLYTSPMLM